MFIAVCKICKRQRRPQRQEHRRGERLTPLAGVTPEMLAWWYGHVPGTMAYAGDVCPRYLVWHPLDHISYEVVRPAAGGGVGPGARLHITEALGRDLDRLIDIRVQVEEFGETGAIIARRVAGTGLVRLENFLPALFADRAGHER